MEDRIAQLEAQIRARMDALAGADPLCNRIMGQIEILREQTPEQAPELTVEKEEEK